MSEVGLRICIVNKFPGFAAGRSPHFVNSCLRALFLKVQSPARVFKSELLTDSNADSWAQAQTQHPSQGMGTRDLSFNQVFQAILQLTEV